MRRGVFSEKNPDIPGQKSLVFFVFLKFLFFLSFEYIYIRTYTHICIYIYIYLHLPMYVLIIACASEYIVTYVGLVCHI